MATLILPAPQKRINKFYNNQTTNSSNRKVMKINISRTYKHGRDSMELGTINECLSSKGGIPS